MITHYSKPHLIRTPKGGHHLVVDGKPFLVLGGELQNSSFSSVSYMEPLWHKLRDDGINTCLVGVYWSTIEPQEGVFDWKELDELLLAARRHDMRLILLWFGSWKNGMSTYVPAWIKRDHKRFERASIPGDNGYTQIVEVLSTFSQTNIEADVKAFSEFMAHLRAFDESHGTVLMVQVENEVGLLGGSRDVSSRAQKVYQGSVSAELISTIVTHLDSFHPHLRKFLASRKLSHQSRGSWADLFGTSSHADEVFMAYHYAIYVNRVASAGKAIYDLPMFTNAWLSSIYKDDRIRIPVMAGGGEDPGTWPSGGPNLEVLDIWKQFAPSLDFLSPDIYLHHYEQVLEAWALDQPLLIPEQRRDGPGLRRMWEAFGTFGALTASPFGVDSLEGPGRDALREHFGLLQQLESYILQAQAAPGSSFGFYFDEPGPNESVNDNVKTVTLGSWELTIKRAFVPGRLEPAYGIVFPLSGDKFLLAGAGYQIAFKSTDTSSIFTGLIHFDEKRVTNARAGTLGTVRRFNGDEIVGGKCVVMPSLKPDAESFPIAIFIPAGTRIAEVELYHLREE
ncbi:hypothetical protein I317_05307 [Kwoniella heveanensis CBS 569]|nr:hypothetical protein I317_05307 [Kwoniella heveanensis CBS 569]